MPNIVEVSYKQTGESTNTNNMGMREMQAKAYEARNSKYLLLKSPPASGKSRALMFLALDKLNKQGLKKVVVAVPERSIGSSFGKTDLMTHGFFCNWEPSEDYNLCIAGSDESVGKVKAFQKFMTNDERILICTHATLRYACEELDESLFNNTLLAIDEFHHVSADGNNRLGDLLRNIMNKSDAHIVAMTGSYFRGDSVPILTPEDESKFSKVTYNYYQQLNGYTYLKSLGIGYNFYQGRYTDAILEVLDTNKKTILHIPNVNSGESTKQKHREVDFILDSIGEILKQDSETGVIHVKRKDGKIIKIADLVEDKPADRDKIVNYLRNIKSAEDMDIIIALGMAKEGFDWPYCEHALTVGYRGSLTEIIQIIGRATRDSSNKTHAQFTNLIAQPDAADDLVKVSVNNMLKAITASLLMEQVLAPNWKFKPKFSDDDKPAPGEIKIRGLKKPSSKRVEEIIASDLTDIAATAYQSDAILASIVTGVDPEHINKNLIRNIIETKYPTLNEDEVEEVRQYVVLDSVIKKSQIVDVGDLKSAIISDSRFKEAIKKEDREQLVPKIVREVYPGLTVDEANSFGKMVFEESESDTKKKKEGEESEAADRRFIRLAGKFVNIDDIHIDLIDQINPFQKAYEMLSKSVTAKVLKVIQDHIDAGRVRMDVEEAKLLWPKVNEFIKTYGRKPSLESNDPIEKRMAECILFLQEMKRKTANNG